jgi:soluble lytic murein transglycosylase-like protein
VLLLSGRGKGAVWAGGPIAWGKEARQKLGEAGYAKLLEVAVRLQTSPDFLATTIKKESNFQTTARNPKSDASGLNQIIPSTARRMSARLGAPITTEKIRALGPVDQLELVYHYFSPAVGQLGTMEDLYAYNFGTASLGKPLSFVMYKEGTGGYGGHKHLDKDDSDTITKYEATRGVVALLAKGRRPENLG